MIDPPGDGIRSRIPNPKSLADSSADPLPSEIDPEQTMRYFYERRLREEWNAVGGTTQGYRFHHPLLPGFTGDSRSAWGYLITKLTAADPALRTLSQQWRDEAALAQVEGVKLAFRKCAADLDRVYPPIEKGQTGDMETRNQQTLQSFLERAELAETEVVRLKAMVETLDARLLDGETNQS